MEGLLDALGMVTLLLLVAVGAASGLIAGRMAGRRTAAYVALGIVGAVATPFVLAALGLGILAAGGILLLLVVAFAGAVILLAVGRALMR